MDEPLHLNVSEFQYGWAIFLSLRPCFFLAQNPHPPVDAHIRPKVSNMLGHFSFTPSLILPCSASASSSISLAATRALLDVCGLCRHEARGLNLLEKHACFIS